MADRKYPLHVFWGAGEPDCPEDLKAANGELIDMRCKVCGDGWLESHDVCMAALKTVPDAERLCRALRQFVKLVPAGDECRLQLTVGAQSFFIGIEPMPEDEAAHFAGLFVLALAGMVQQVTTGVAVVHAALPVDRLEQLIDAYLEDYEMVGEAEDGRDAFHQPTDDERALIKDAIFGLLANEEWDAEWGKLIEQRARERAARGVDLPGGAKHG